MRRLDLDYAPRSPWANRTGLLVLASAVLAAAGMPALYVHYADEKDARQTRLKQLERSEAYLSGQPLPSGAAAQDVQSGIRRANEITAQLDLPWNPLFEVIEASSHETVALLGIQPDAQKRVVSIAAEARDMPSALAWVKRLGQDPILSETHIVNHQMQEQDPQTPIRFSVQAVWRERQPGPEKQR